MRHFKIASALLLCLFFTLTIVSCNMSSDNEQQYGYSTETVNETSNTGMDNDTTKSLFPKELKAALYSVNGLKKVVTELSANMDALEIESQQTKESVDNLEKEIEAQKDKGIWSIIVGWVLGFISIVLAIISIIKANGLNRRMNRHRKEIDLLNQELNNVKLSLPTKNSYAKPGYSSTSSITRSQYDELLREINNLKLQLPPSSMPNHDYGYRPLAQDKPNTVSKKKEGYFSQVIKGGEDQGYFKKLQDSRDSDSRFSVVVDGNTAEFRPIVQVREIISSDAMDLAVDFKGVSKSEANSMTVDTSGEAQLSGDKWFIKRKAIVILK